MYKEVFVLQSTLHNVQIINLCLCIVSNAVVEEVDGQVSRLRFTMLVLTSINKNQVLCEFTITHPILVILSGLSYISKPSGRSW